MDTELVVIAKESGLEQPKIDGLLSKFGESFEQTRQAIELAKGINVTSEDQTEEMEQAGIARKELKNIRVAVEHTRKELKEQSLREGKAIDGMANIIKAMIVPVEEHLEKQEKFAENLAKERKQRLIAERMSTLMGLTDTPTMYAYENMEQEAFDKLVEELKAAKEAKELAAQKAEAERIAAEKAAAVEQERIRKENAKLKAEAEAREVAMAKERAQAEAARKAAEETARKEREAIEAKAAKERAEVEAKLAKEREAREAAEKLEAERKAKIAAQQAAEQAAKTKALLAPDKEKLMAFADTIDRLELPNLANREAGKLLDETKDFLNRISMNLRNKAKEL